MLYFNSDTNYLDFLNILSSNEWLTDSTIKAELKKSQSRN